MLFAHSQSVAASLPQRLAVWCPHCWVNSSRGQTVCNLTVILQACTICAQIPTINLSQHKGTVTICQSHSQCNDKKQRIKMFKDNCQRMTWTGFSNCYSNWHSYNKNTVYILRQEERVAVCVYIIQY